MTEKIKPLKLTAESVAKIKSLFEKFPSRKSVVLPVLHIIYEQFGYLDRDAIAEAAEICDVAKVHFEEAADFYTMFPLKPVGKYLIQVCRNISCSLLGSEELVEYLKSKLNIDIGETTPDGLFTLVVVECLGSCGTAPVAQINDKYYENLTREKIDRILAELRNRQ